MDYLAQQLINGLVLGSIYGLIAIGYTMVYGIVGMINFAHGDIFMIGGFIALISFLVLVSLGLTAVPVILLIVLLVSMAMTALYGWTVERIAYRPAVQRGHRHRNQKHDQEDDRHGGQTKRNQDQKADQRDETADHENVAMGEIDHPLSLIHISEPTR